MNLLLIVLVLVGCACGSPLAGRWQGTADIGPVRAQQLVLELDEQGQTGRLHVADPGRTEAFRLCRVQRHGRSLELQYDAARPSCEGNAGAPSELRTLKGTVGEGVVWGQIWRGTENIGFFRAFASWIGP